MLVIEMSSSTCLVVEDLMLVAFAKLQGPVPLALLESSSVLTLVEAEHACMKDVFMNHL